MGGRVGTVLGGMMHEETVAVIILSLLPLK